jgi:hypothetical protein
VIDLRRSCNRYRPVLVDFVDRGELGPSTGAALAHLDRCGRCTEAIESTMLTITALRRLGEEAVAVQPAADAWPRLQARILTQPKLRGSLVYPMARAVLTIGLAGLLVTPIHLAETATRETPAASVAAPTAAAARLVATTSFTNRRIAEAPGPNDPGATHGQPALRMVIPDGNAEAGKELPSVPSSGPRTWTR